MVFVLVGMLLVFTLGVIFFVLHKIFGGEMKGALDRLQTLQRESLEKEEVLTKELERTKVQCQNEITRSKEEAKILLENARHTAEKITAEAVEKAEGITRRMAVESEERLRHAERDVRAGARQCALQLAEEMVSMIFTPHGQDAVHHQMIEEVVESLRRLEPGRLTGICDQAIVRSSVPLTSQEKVELAEILSAKLGGGCRVEEHIDSGLIMGMVIQVGGFVIDGSLKNKLAKAADVLRHEDDRMASAESKSKA